MNDTIYLISIVYIGYSLGKITDFLIEKIDETLKKKRRKAAQRTRKLKMLQKMYMMV